MGFSKNLTTALEHRGITQEFFANRCGITQGEMDTYIRADIYPDPPMLRKMADELKLKVSDLAGDDDLQFTSFGSELRRLRKENGMTQGDLGTLLEIPPNRITKYEHDLCRPKADTNNKLADLFGEEYTMIVKKYMTANNDAPKASGKPKKQKVVFIDMPKTPEDTAYGKEIGYAIREARKELGVTATYAASLLNVSAPTYVRLEAGAIPRKSLAMTIKERLGVDVEKIQRPTVVKKPETTVVSKPEPIVASEPVAAVTNKPLFKSVWIDYLDMIEDDSEYRKASTVLLNHIFNGGDITVIEGAPQANIILKMIQKGV